jgi:hypothetical protein
MIELRPDGKNFEFMEQLGSLTSLLANGPLGSPREGVNGYPAAKLELEVRSARRRHRGAHFDQRQLFALNFRPRPNRTCFRCRPPKLVLPKF